MKIGFFNNAGENTPYTPINVGFGSVSDDGCLPVTPISVNFSSSGQQQGCYPPCYHSHPYYEVTGLTYQTLLGRYSSGTGAAELITLGAGLSLSPSGVLSSSSSITLTTSGTSGAATLVSNTLNIPQYQAAYTILSTFGALANASGVLTNDGSGVLYWATPATGTVTSVGLSAPAIFTVTGSPVTSSGTLDFTPNNAQGDIIYGSAANTLSYLTKSTTANQFLSNGGTNNNPSWATVTASMIGSGAALTKLDDANVTLTLGGSPTTALLSAVSLALGWSGQLSLARGGTNANLTASNGAVAYSTASAMALSAVGSTGQIFQSNGAAAPTWSTPTYPSASGTSGNVLRSDGTNNVYSTFTIADTYSQYAFLYASTANTVTAFATANTSALVTSSTGVPSWASGTTANRVLTTDGTTVSFAQVALTTMVTGVLPIANGGTNSSTALNNNRPIVSSGGKIVEASAIAATSVYFADANGLPTGNTNFAYTSGSYLLTIANGASTDGTLTIGGSATYATSGGTAVALNVSQTSAAGGTIAASITNVTTSGVSALTFGQSSTNRGALAYFGSSYASNLYSGNTSIASTNVTRLANAASTGDVHLVGQKIYCITEGGTSSTKIGWVTGLVGMKIGPLSSLNTAATAYLTLAAGTATASTAPLKFISGTSMATAEIGAIEYTTPQLFFTNGGAIRQEIQLVQQSRVSTQFNKTSDTTLANITGLSGSLAAGKTYKFETILYTTSNNSGGVKVAIAGTCTATNIIYESLTTDGATVVGVGTTRATALATTVSNHTSVTAALIKITGTITCNAAGTLTVQFAQNASNGTASSVLVGSVFIINEMA